MKNIKQIVNMKKILLITSLLITIMYSCKDDNVIDNLEQQNLQSSNDYLLAEKTLIDIERVIESSFISTGTTKNCPSYTIRKINNSDTIVETQDESDWEEIDTN